MIKRFSGFVAQSKKPVLYGAAAVTLALLTGCAAIGGTTATADTYELRQPSIGSVSPVRAGTQILIAEPVALKAFDSENIVIRPEPLVIQYLGDARWSDRLPRLVQRKLGDAFQAANRFDGVGLPGQGLAIDYQVITEIREFSVDAQRNAADVTIAAKLLNDRNGNVLASRSFSATVPVGGTSNDVFVAGLDRAFGRVAADIVSWVADRI